MGKCLDTILDNIAEDLGLQARKPVWNEDGTVNWDDAPVTYLGAEEYDWLVNLIENPPPASPFLKEAYRKYKEMIKP